MTRALRLISSSLLVGILLTLAIAWAAVFASSEVSPVPWCSRAWPIDAQRVGTVLDTEFDWWLPVDVQEASVQPGKIVLTAEEDEWPQAFSGPVVYFTGYDSWAASLHSADLCNGPPSWYDHFKQPSSKVEVVVRVSAGWPWRCFEGFGVHARPRDNQGLLTSAYHGLLRHRRLDPLPYWPIPGPLAANVVVWSTAVFLSRMIALGATAHRRRCRGLCTACGHCRLGLPPDAPCPECGQRITVRPRQLSLNPRRSVASTAA